MCKTHTRAHHLSPLISLSGITGVENMLPVLNVFPPLCLSVALSLCRSVALLLCLSNSFRHSPSCFFIYFACSAFSICTHVCIVINQSYSGGAWGSHTHTHAITHTQAHIHNSQHNATQRNTTQHNTYNTHNTHNTHTTLTQHTHTHIHTQTQQLIY